MTSAIVSTCSMVSELASTSERPLCASEKPQCVVLYVWVLAMFEEDQSHWQFSFFFFFFFNFLNIKKKPNVSLNPVTIGVRYLNSILASVLSELQWFVQSYQSYGMDLIFQRKHIIHPLSHTTVSVRYIIFHTGFRFIILASNHQSCSGLCNPFNVMEWTCSFYKIKYNLSSTE